MLVLWTGVSSILDIVYDGVVLLVSQRHNAVEIVSRLLNAAAADSRVTPAAQLSVHPRNSSIIDKNSGHDTARRRWDIAFTWSQHSFSRHTTV